MVETGTFLIDHRNYFTFPDTFSHELDPPSVQRLIFKGSGHCKIELEGEQWRNLQTIMIQGCHFVDIRINIPEGQLREIIVGSSKYVSMLDVRGTFPKMEQWAFDHCKYLSLKGPFIGKMALKQIIIANSPQFKLFDSPGLLPYLEIIEILQSHHGKVDFGVIEVPRIRKINFEECNTIKIKTIGTLLSTLSEFVITRCNKIWMNEIALDKLRNFSGFKYTSVKPEHELFAQLIGFSESTPNMTEIEGELADLEQNYNDDTSVRDLSKVDEADEVEDLDAINIQMKFCSECGQKALYMAKFCPNCGEQFRQQ